MRIATLMTTAIVALGTVVFAQTVSFDYDRTADFTRFKSYTWVRGTHVNDVLNHNRIVSAIDAQLAAKGFTRLQAGANSDVLVAYHAAFDKDLQITGFGSGWGPYRFAGRSVSARAEEIVVGTVAVDMVDARTNAIVWRGMATNEVDVHASAEKRDKNINRAAAKLFKDYPPKR